MREYLDSKAYLTELSGTYVDGFNDCLHQVKASFLDLDLAHVSIVALAQTPAQTPAQPVYSESTDELFANDAFINDATRSEERRVGKECVG